jgi:hypothetical protein
LRVTREAEGIFRIVLTGVGVSIDLVQALDQTRNKGHQCCSGKAR